MRTIGFWGLKLSAAAIRLELDVYPSRFIGLPCADLSCLSLSRLLVPVVGFGSDPRAMALVSPELARQVGLERMWYTQIGLDRGRGQVAGVFLHVSATQSHTVFQITHDGRRYVFSQRDRNAFGKEIGVEGAQKEADSKAEEIKKQLQDSGKADAAAPTVEKFVVPKITLVCHFAARARYTRSMPKRAVRCGQRRSAIRCIPRCRLPQTISIVAVCNGSTLYLMQASDGAVIWTSFDGGLARRGAGHYRRLCVSYRW